MESVDLEERGRALDRFFGFGVRPENLRTHAYWEFMDWFAFRADVTRTGEPFYRHFAKTRTAQAEQELLERWSENRFSFYRVSRAGGETTFFDVLSPKSFRIVAATESLPPPESLALCHILPLSGETWTTGYLVREFPPDFLETFKPVLNAELTRLQHAQPSATIADLVRLRWPLLRDLIELVYGYGRAPVPGTPPFRCKESSDPLLLDPFSLSVQEELERYVEAHGWPFVDRCNVVRLWREFAMRERPATGRPGIWAAGAAWLYMAVVMHRPFKQADVAAALGTTASSVGQRARTIDWALQVVSGDSRFADLLDPVPRNAYFGQAYPEGTWRFLRPASLIDPDQFLIRSAYRPKEREEAHSQQPDLGPQQAANILALHEKIQECLGKGDRVGGRRLCEELLRLDPRFLPARNNLAVVMAEEGEFEQAIQTAAPVLKAQPDYPFTHALLAFCHGRLGRPRKAKPHLDVALAAYNRWKRAGKHKHDDYHSTVHLLWRALGANDEDETLFTLAQQHDPVLLGGEALRVAAIAAQRMVHLDQAVTWLKAACKESPRNVLLAMHQRVLDLIRQASIPAFFFSYDWTETAPLDAPEMPATMRVILIDAIWWNQKGDAAGLLQELGRSRDPWIGAFLRAYLLRPDLPPELVTAALDGLFWRGDIREGELVLGHRNGLMTMYAVQAQPLPLQRRKR